MVSAILTMFLPFVKNLKFLFYTSNFLLKDTTGKELDTNKTLNNLADFKLESNQEIKISEKI